MTSRRLTVACGLVLALLAACTAATGASTTSAVPPVAPMAPASSPPVVPSAAPSGSGAALGGNPGAPALTPIPIQPGGPGGSIGVIPVQPPIEVQPVANLKNIHAVQAETVSATVSGGRVTATVVWWSGPEPCSALADVAVQRSGNAFVLTVREGSKDLMVACPAIATHKMATVDMGILPAGTYTISATGIDAAPVTVTVTG